VNDKLRRAAISFAIFVTVCVVGTFALLAIFSQFRFSKEQLYRAEFTDVSGLATGDFVRIAGAEVGQVKKISISPNGHAVVEFSIDPSVVLTEGSKAAIRWKNPIGDRYMALFEGAGGLMRLSPGGVIALARTEPALDLDTLLGGFRPLFRALNPEQVNALSGQLIAAFQGEGATIGSFLSQAAAVTNTLADRDELIGQVIGNLDAVLASFGDQNRQLAKGVDSLSELIKGLAARKSDISNAVAYTNAASATIADLLIQARPPFKNVVAQSDRATSLVLADHDYFDDLLNTLPDVHKQLALMGLFGSYWSFYLCDLVLKLNGKGGQPVYVKLAGQDTGRCSVRNRTVHD
jgi:phospholipid/cholesterol/gamma-HCH transport system substrate-binding protein